jgi:hypothetical protein
LFFTGTPNPKKSSKIDIPRQNVKVRVFLQEHQIARVESKIDIARQMLKFQVIYQKNFKRSIFTVKITQAAVILKCCNFNRTDQQEFTNYVITKFKTDLDGQLNNLI